MKKWDIELSYGIGFTVSGVEAETKEEAIKKAQQAVESGTSVVTGPDVDEGDLEFDQCSFVKQIR